MEPNQDNKNQPTTQPNPAAKSDAGKQAASDSKPKSQWNPEWWKDDQHGAA